MRCLLTSGLPGTPARHSRPPRAVSSAFGVICAPRNAFAQRAAGC